MGYSMHIYKLAFLSHREREELMEGLNMMPGHRDKMQDLFKIIEQLNPIHTLRSTLKNAVKGPRRKNQSQQRDEVNKSEQKPLDYKSGP
jgi:hypothetical protein